MCHSMCVKMCLALIVRTQCCGVSPHAARCADEAEYPDPAMVLDDMYVSDNERCGAR